MTPAGQGQHSLKDYRPPDFLVDEVYLTFQLYEEQTLVTSRLTLRRAPGAAADAPLHLDGEDLSLRWLRLDGQHLRPSEYQLHDAGLTLPVVPDRFVLETEVAIEPQRNTALEGLYRSNGMFCTQCEAEGFRRITYYPDRPDVLARFTTVIEADRERYPVLLGNGNPVAQESLPEGRHRATWEDPFPKPCYLFALVAGDLGVLRDEFVTASGRRVALGIYTEPGDEARCQHAMASLKQAMAWDEQTYGRECDLDHYNIVAVSHFNMGAMENKGLNIFNSRYVLADPQTATDQDYQHIAAVIAHEYLHNWSGNRVTCRDWFQLSLKEGFTVFRDQQFSASRGSAGVKRVADVRVLRSHQFAEDAGPLAHPVQPEAYQEINNFYTTTIYNKGAEVVRMLSVLLGWETFRRGTDLYFERFDGQAVTVQDFVAVMAEVSGRDLSQFERWYHQAGTPLLEVASEFLPDQGHWRLLVKQSTPPTPGQPEKLPVTLPLRLALLDEQGRHLPARLLGDEADAGLVHERVLEINEAVSTFTFTGLQQPPVASLLRGFSAPVRLDYTQSRRELALLIAHDDDPFVRWDAAQRLALGHLLAEVDPRGMARDEQDHSPALLIDALARVLDGAIAALREDPEQTQVDLLLVNEILIPPSEGYVADQLTQADPGAIHRAHKALRVALARALRSRLLALHELCAQTRGQDLGGIAQGRRALANRALGLLAELKEPQFIARAAERLRAADNMTDALAALQVLASGDGPERSDALGEFYQRWRHDDLVLDKWFSVQASAERPDVVAEVAALEQHPDFDFGNPNRVRALLGAFAQGNPAALHHPDGVGYRLLADAVLRLDGTNPQLAARLLVPLTRWQRLEPGRRKLLQRELQRIAGVASLSVDVGEIVTKALA